MVRTSSTSSNSLTMARAFTYEWRQLNFIRIVEVLGHMKIWRNRQITVSAPPLYRRPERLAGKQRIHSLRFSRWYFAVGDGTNYLPSKKPDAIINSGLASEGRDPRRSFALFKESCRSRPFFIQFNVKKHFEFGKWVATSMKRLEIESLVSSIPLSCKHLSRKSLF